MNKSFESMRDLWIKAQLKAPPMVQQLIPRLHEAKEMFRLLARPYIPVYQLQGQGQAGPLVVTYAGLEYARPVLQSLLFIEPPTEQKVGQIPFWRCHELANLYPNDLIIVEAVKHLIRRLPHQNAIVLPEFVRHMLDVRGNWEEVQGRFRKTVHKNDLRRIRKYGYEYDVSQDPQDFEEFYHQMYLPTMAERHEDLSMPMTIGEAYQNFRYGYLFRIKRDGVWVAGGVCHAEHDVLMLDIIGVKNADAQLIQEGVMAARYYAAIEWANQRGYRAVNFRGSGPYMKIGQFQYKRKWGTTVHLPPQLHRWIWLKIHRNTPAVSQFLKENPVVVIDQEEKLHGLIVVDDPPVISTETQQEWEKQYATPGLSSLLIRSVNSFTEKQEGTSDPSLVVPILSNSSLANGR